MLFTMKNGLLVLIVGPSGSGKGTVIAELKKRHPDWIFPVSVTTRLPRPREINGQVYHFISKDEFLRRREQGELLEWAEVHKQDFYGTLKQPILSAIETGKIVVREIDIQGFQSVRKIIPREQLMSVFFVADLEMLKKRILGRSKLSNEELARRMESAKKEIAQSGECDHIVESKEGSVQRIVDEVEKLILHLWGVPP